LPAMLSIRLQLITFPLNCRGGCHFWRPKSNQKRFQQKCFYAAHAFTLQTRQKLGCNLFAWLTFLSFTLHAKICYALQPHRPPLFCRVLAEAYLLKNYTYPGKISNYEKGGKG